MPGSPIVCYLAQATDTPPGMKKTRFQLKLTFEVARQLYVDVTEKVVWALWNMSSLRSGVSAVSGLSEIFEIGAS